MQEIFPVKTFRDLSYKLLMIIILCSFTQIYIGNRGTTDVVENCNVVKDLKIGMMLAFRSMTNQVPDIGKVCCIASNPNINSQIEVKLFKQERAPHKPKWLRYFFPTDKKCTLLFSDVLLYDFELTRKGSLKKKTREFLINK